MTTYNPADYTIEEVHEHLAQHPEDRQAVLEAEQARGNEARSTLVNSLQSQSQAQSGEQPVQQEGEAPAKPEDERISAPGEYPDDREGTWGYHSDEPGVQAGRQEG